MPISLKRASGGGGLFRLLNRVGGSIPAGVTGNIATITAPSGQVARLTFLYASGATQAGISVISDGNTVLSGTLSADLSSIGGSFSVGETVLAATSAPFSDGSRVVKNVVGDSIIINKNTGNTTQIINYLVEYGMMI